MAEDELLNDPRRVARLTVIDEALMLKAIRHEARVAEDDPAKAKRRAQEITDVSTATELALSFQNLADIGGLVGLQSVQRLFLDNNYIRTIENLGHLTQLSWLDLSFNRIGRIEGLEALVNLTDLSLFGNRIEEVAGLDTLTKLECLSIGNNLIERADSIAYLRCLPKLRSLCLRGNPVAEDGEYTSHVIAQLPNLVFLDYALIKDEQRGEAEMAFQDLVQENVEREAVESAAREKREAQREVEEELQRAHMLFLLKLFDDMFEKDKEKAKMEKLPGQEELQESFHEKYSEAAEECKAAGLKLARRSARELSMFKDAIKAVRQHMAEGAAALVLKLEGQLKRAFRDMDARQEASPDDLDSVRREGVTLAQELQRREQHLVEDFQDLFSKFESSFNDLKTDRLKASTAFFRQVEALEDAYSDGLNKLLDDMLEQFAEGKLEQEELPAEVIVMLQSKDVAKAAVNNSHDNHLSRILAFEGEMEEALSKEVKSTLEGFTEEEHKRNRARMVEIREFRQSVGKRIDDYIAREFPDSE